ncbi:MULTISPECIES: hypothetical protein [unclassified Ensifer]|nr:MULTISPECIES: hypothetical protein [unclassified Ensifer]
MRQRSLEGDNVRCANPPVASRLTNRGEDTLHMQGTDLTTREIERAGRLDRELDSRLGAVLPQAIEAADYAWRILATEIQRLGYSVEKPVPENETLYCYFDAIKWDALEMSDSIYWSLSDEEREKDDRDLEDFEASYLLREDYSARIKALAFLTVGKNLVCPEY